MLITLMGQPPLALAAHTKSHFVPFYLVPGVRISWPGSGPLWHELLAAPTPDPRPGFEGRLLVRLRADSRPEGELLTALPPVVEVDLDSVAVEIACRRLTPHWRYHRLNDAMRQSALKPA